MLWGFIDSSHEYWTGYCNKLSPRHNHPLESTCKCPYILQTGGERVSRVTTVTFHGSLFGLHTINPFQVMTGSWKWTAGASEQSRVYCLDSSNRKSDRKRVSFWQSRICFVLQQIFAKSCQKTLSAENSYRIWQDCECHRGRHSFLFFWHFRVDWLTLRMHSSCLALVQISSLFLRKCLWFVQLLSNPGRPTLT